MRSALRSRRMSRRRSPVERLGQAKLPLRRADRRVSGFKRRLADDLHRNSLGRNRWKLFAL